MRYLQMLLASLFVTAFATACGGNKCDDFVDEVNSCFSSLDCSTKAEGTERDGCTAAKTAHESASGGEAGECNELAEALAQTCLDSNSINAENNCTCTLGS